MDFQHTRFSSLSITFLGQAVEYLIYSEKGVGKLQTTSTIVALKTGRIRAFQPVDELLMVLMRLRLSLLEQNLAYRFYVSQSTISRV